MITIRRAGERGHSNHGWLASGQRACVCVAKGAVDVNGHALDASHPAAIEAESRLALRATAPSDVLLIGLP